MRARRTLLLAVVIAALALAALALLSVSMLGPRIGNIFSNVVYNLEALTPAALEPTSTVIPTNTVIPTSTAIPFEPITPGPPDRTPTPEGAFPTRETITPGVGIEQTAFAVTALAAQGYSLTSTGVGIEQTAFAVTAEATAETGDSPPSSPATPSPTPVKIADATLLIRDDVSGDVIGDGTLSIFAPAQARYPESALVRLELNLDNFYIMSTPSSGSITPPPRATTVLGSPPAPREPRITDSGVPVYQRMGASLFCAARAFDGCDAGYEMARAKPIVSRLTSWEWTIFPQQGIAGRQNLRLEVWITARNLDGSIEVVGLEGAQYSFEIDVNPAGGPPVGLLAALVAAVAAVAVVWRWRRGAKPAAAPPSRPARPAGAAPLVFISYRRGSSWGQARSIAQSLEARGAQVFIDVDDINEGRFAEIIEKTIARCDYFVAVLAPDSLESPWVRREIRYALQHNKVIIPLLTAGFHLAEQALPEDIRDIASHNAITLVPEFYEEAIGRLASRFLKL